MSFVILLLTGLLSLSCSKHKALSPEAKACVQKYDDRIAYLGKCIVSLSNAYEVFERMSLNALEKGTQKSNDSNFDAALLNQNSEQMDKWNKQLEALEREKWETELRKPEFTLKQTR